MAKKTTPINWVNFSIFSVEFLKAEKDHEILQLLHEYFSKNSTSNENFVVELAEKYPEDLLNAIRPNRAFLNPNHLESFQFLKNHSNKRLREHYLVFSKLANQERELFTEFQHLISVSNQNETIEVMCWISLWFEEKRAALFLINSNQSFVYDINPYIDAINFYLSYYLFENKGQHDSIKIKNDSDFETILEIAKQKNFQLNYINNNVRKALDSAFRYLHFLKGTIEIYSFDFNYDVEVNYGIAELKCLDLDKLRKWHIDNAKIGYWNNYYREIAISLVNHEISENPNFIKNKSGFDYEMNLEGTIRETIANLIAADFCIDSSLLEGVPSKSLIKFINGFVNNALGRYVFPMDKLNHQNPEDWFNNILLNIQHFGQRGIAASSIRLIDKSEFNSKAQENIDESINYTDKLIELITSDISNLKYVNRLNPPVNLVGKPFIKIGDYYLAFNGLLGESNSQTNILINIMDSNKAYHQNVMQKEIMSLEQKLKDQFKDAGFKNTDCTMEYSLNGIPHGDFDVVVYEDGVMLLIELKRSKMRIHLSDAHDEYVNSLSKASKQLDKAVNYINNNFEKCKIEQFKNLDIKELDFAKMKIYPIIVSTSFEHDHELIRGKHLKISLFELQNILLNKIEGISGNNLESLIMNVFSNRYWEALEHDVELPNVNYNSIKFEV